MVHTVQDTWDRKDEKIQELEKSIQKLMQQQLLPAMPAPLNATMATATNANGNATGTTTTSGNAFHSSRGVSRSSSANGSSERMQSAYQALKVRNEGIMALNKSLEQRLQECEEDRNLLGASRLGG